MPRRDGTGPGGEGPGTGLGYGPCKKRPRDEESQPRYEKGHGNERGSCLAREEFEPGYRRGLGRGPCGRGQGRRGRGRRFQRERLENQFD